MDWKAKYSWAIKWYSVRGVDRCPAAEWNCNGIGCRLQYHLLGSSRKQYNPNVNGISRYESLTKLESDDSQK